jgi:hypothetical protein
MARQGSARCYGVAPNEMGSRQNSIRLPILAIEVYEAEADAFKRLQAVRRWRGDPPDSAEPAGVPGLK